MLFFHVSGVMFISHFLTGHCVVFSRLFAVYTVDPATAAHSAVSHCSSREYALQLDEERRYVCVCVYHFNGIINKILHSVFLFYVPINLSPIY